MKRLDLTDQRFGRLIALWFSDKDNGGHYIWLCRCDCGKITEVSSNSLRMGKTKSCGCLRQERASKRLHKHGERYTRLYNIWTHMKGRCYNPNRGDYRYYGGKGITLYGKWKNNFIIFREWALGNGYNDNLCIDRINSDGNYEPDNCQFITQPENTAKSNRERRWKQ